VKRNSVQTPRQFFVILFSLLAVPVWAADPSPPVVLGLPLGGERTQIKALFANAKIPVLKRDANMTVYKEPLVNIKDGGTTALAFYEGKLAKILVLLTVKSQNIEPYVSRYRELQTSLIEKYGFAQDSVEFMDPSYQNPFLALILGRGAYGTAWRMSDSNLDISLTLKGDNFQVSFTLEYADRSLFQQYRRLRETQEKDGL
jgi:hypothetical protein